MTRKTTLDRFGLAGVCALVLATIIACACRPLSTATEVPAPSVFRSGAQPRAHGPKGQPAHVAPFPTTCLKRASGIVIVRMGDGADIDLARWAAEFQADYGVETSIASPLSLPGAGFDESRKQWPTDPMLALLKQTHNADMEKRVIVLGVTTAPLYFSDKPEWRYTFGSYTYSEMKSSGAIAGMHGAISTDMMRHNDPDITKERLSKLTARFLGTLHCGFERGNVAEASPMRSSVLSVSDLDAIDRNSWGFEK
jgi:hypothetical protein